MATATAPVRALPALPGRRYDKVFFSGMALLMLGIVFVGFARTYFLAGMLRAHLPSPIIHVHGAVFIAWTLLLVTQTSLVASGNVATHRKLGLWTFGLAALMVALGAIAATSSLGRNFSPAPGLDAQTFYAIPIFAIVIFGALIAAAYRERMNSAAHKRFILLATIALMGAPTGRPPFATMVAGHPHLSSVFVWSLLAMLWIYDLWALHKIHKASLLGGLFMVIVDQLSVPIGMTHAWHTMANALQHIARG